MALPVARLVFTLRCVAELGYERRLAAAESRTLKAQTAVEFFHELKITVAEHPAVLTHLLHAFFG